MECESVSFMQRTAAERLAEKLFQANLAAIRARQPGIADDLRLASRPPVTWIFGRDGSLTARHAAGQWWGGSSLPMRVGASLMKSLEMAGAVGCMLAPATAGQIRAALDNTTAAQAIIVVVPDLAQALVILHCVDFSREIVAGRLWLACGADWEKQLAELLEKTPGLCVPQQYIRSSLLRDAELCALTASANAVLSTQTSRRAELSAQLLRDWKPSRRAIGVVAGSAFSLWELAGPTLAHTLAGWTHLDTDQPMSASPLALAMTAQECDAIIAADLYRSDLPGVVPDQVHWLTWVTKPRFAASAAPGDAVLLADEEWRKPAMDAGWPADRLAVAAWPMLVDPTPAPPSGPVAFVADATLCEMPEKLRNFSSQGVLWEQIAAELMEDPFAVGESLDDYLDSRIRQFDIDGQTLDRAMFRRKLLLPVWRRGVARLMRQARLPLVVFGSGWDQTDEFAACWGGPVRSMEDLRRIASLAAAVVRPSPSPRLHPVSALGRPVLRPGRPMIKETPIPCAATLSLDTVLALRDRLA
jgi:hypothetical protein